VQPAAGIGFDLTTRVPAGVLVFSSVWVWVAVVVGVGVAEWIARRMWRPSNRRISVDAVSEGWLAHQRGQDDLTK